LDQFRPDGRPYRYGMTYEEAPADGHRSAVTEVRSDRPPDPRGQRQYPRSPCLATHDPKGSLAPVDVLDVERAHFADPQAEINLAERHGIVAATGQRGSVKAGEELAELFIGQRARNVIKSPKGDMRDGGHQPRVAVTPELEEPEKASQGARRNLCQ